MEREVLKYLHTDLLCYPCDDPVEVAAAQEQAWGPWRTWFEKRFGYPLETTTGIAALRQDEAAVEAVAKAVQGFDDGRFTVLQLAVPLSGSLVLGLAFAEGAAGADDVMKATFAEEDYKAVLYKDEQYGPDPLTEKKRKASRRDLEAASLFLSLLQK
ncbi:MAG TPA: ATP12 family protein, partial [Alphaproteobacteria bacterium]|nr:ATP12 family protein [Alphaproteobacteria bacterium]